MDHPLSNDASLSDDGDPTIIMPIEEFASDLELKLGRANGNVYVRKSGVEGLHDGQIMVRLKKKRFVILDYSIIPNQADLDYASVTPNVLVPNGAGKQKCASQDCTKVGVPVCLFDSDPEQPVSLYLRSGLCFTCQRMLNEKRRTQRKRKSDMNPSHAHGVDGSALHLGPSGGVDHYPMDSVKRFRLGGEILDLNPDAIIINGPLDDTKSHGHGYEFPEIGQDLQKITHDVFENTSELTNTVNSLTEIPCDVNSQEHAHILGLYEKAFVSISKGIFLLNQWKASWDTVIANAAAEKAAEHALEGSSISVPNADVIASAAAVAAAQSVSNDQSSSNFVPLLMEKRQAEQSGDIEMKPDHEEDEEDKPEIYGV